MPDEMEDLSLPSGNLERMQRLWWNPPVYSRTRQFELVSLVCVYLVPKKLSMDLLSIDRCDRVREGAAAEVLAEMPLPPTPEDVVSVRQKLRSVVTSDM